MSYYMMSKAAKYASGAWLRWCWQAYLGMGVPNEDAIPDMDGLTQKQVLQRRSNAAEWEKSPWSKAPFNRLARVIEGIPTMKITDESPAFLIVVNKADSLYSEGMELSKALRKIGASVSLFEHSGVHVLGSIMDVKGRAERDGAWLDILFPTS
jgi:acetyl esterase/lipase